MHLLSRSAVRTDDAGQILLRYLGSLCLPGGYFSCRRKQKAGRASIGHLCGMYLFFFP